MEWQPIETAPKDGSRILTVKAGFAVCIGWWFIDAEKWMTTDAEDYMDDESWNDFVNHTQYEPTNWMPLPNPPSM